MKQIVAWFSLAVIAAVFVVSTCILFASCMQARPPQDPWVAAYTMELLQCVDRAETRDDSHKCREAVEAKYAPLMDGGVWEGGADR